MTIGGNISKSMLLNTGVPQGSIFGPLLFIIYTSDLPLCLPLECKLFIYADDSAITCISSNINEIENNLNTALGRIYDWCARNKLTINANKTKSMLIGSKQKVHNTGSAGSSVVKVNYVKCLGVIIDESLSWQIKSDSKSFYAYVRSKQNVRDRVGPLEDNAGNKITQGILMAEELNMHFSSVFTREDTSSLPVPETKFEGSEGERLGQLVVTPEVVANKINNMKENKSPGVDGIAPKILKETVEQICTPLAHVFNMSLQEGIVPLEWKEANIIPLFKKGSRNKSVNYRPVSLTSVICKVL